MYTEPTCMSLDSVTLLISMGLGLKAPVPSKDSCRTQHAHNLVSVVFTLAAGCVNVSACYLSVLGWPVISSWTCCGGWQGHPPWSGQCSSPMRAWSSETLWLASSTPLYPAKWTLSYDQKWRRTCTRKFISLIKLQENYEKCCNVFLIKVSASIQREYKLFSKCFLSHRRNRWLVTPGCPGPSCRCIKQTEKKYLHKNPQNYSYDNSEMMSSTL